MLTHASGLDEVIHPTHKALSLIRALSEAGFDPEPALAGTAMQLSDLSDTAARMSARQLLAICDNVRRINPDPLFPMRAGRLVHATHLGFFGFALLCSATPREGMVCMNRYRTLSTPIIGVGFREEAGRCVLTYFDSLDMPPGLFRFVLDFQLGIGRTLLDDTMGIGFAVDEVRVTYPESGDTGELEGLLEAPISFGCEANQLIWDSAWMDRPQRYANSLTAMMVRDNCERMLADAQAELGTAGAVARMLVEQPGRFPGLEEIADRLHLTSRTLRRKLSAEGSSYASILASTRRRMAIEYLRTTRMKIEEVAEAVGFADVANFRHAFRKWTGHCPSDYRGRAGTRRKTAGAER